MYLWSLSPRETNAVVDNYEYETRDALGQFSDIVKKLKLYVLTQTTRSEAKENKRVPGLSKANLPQ